MYCSPVRMRCTAASSASWPVMGGRLANPARFIAAIAPLAIPSFLLDPISVTADKIKDTIIKDGFYKASEICTAEVAAACAKVGIQ